MTISRPLLLAAALLAGAYSPAVLAQGSTGAISRPGWSAGQAPSSDFNAQGTPKTRSQALRERSAAATGKPATQRPSGRATRSASRSGSRAAGQGSAQ